VIDSMKELSAPVANDGPKMWDLVIADVSTMGEPLMFSPRHSAVIADMRARDAEGVRRYGVPLQAHNGRPCLIDAYQEALDLTVYLRQAIEEGVPVNLLYQEALRIVFDLKGVLAVQ